MGHTFALDSNYLRMSGEELAKEYMKAADRLTFLTITTGITEQQLTETLQDRDAKIDRLERQVDELSMFLQHMSSNWKPIEPEKKREEKYILWNPQELGKHLKKTRGKKHGAWWSPETLHLQQSLPSVILLLREDSVSGCAES